MHGQNNPDFQLRKKAFTAQIKLSMLLIGACLSLRFVPAANNWLSGPAQPVRALTRALARITAEQVHSEFPVLVVRDENSHCESVTRVDAGALPGTVYYVWSYSEQQHFSCLTSYAVPEDGFQGREDRVVIVDSARAESFGRRLDEPVRVIPFDRSLRVHGVEYLYMLDWRTEVHFPLTHEVAAGQTFYNRETSGKNPRGEDVEISFAELRADVARRHNWVNLALWSGVGLALLLLAKTSLNLLGLYRQFIRQYADDGSPLSYSSFMMDDLNARAAQAEKRKREQRELGQQEARSRRLRAEMEEKLRYVLETTTDESLRSRIASCLADPQTTPAAMQALLEEVQQQPLQKSPQERLEALLDSFQQYCTEEEWEMCSDQAHSILKQAGFRAAREYAIEMHDQFRAREKAKEEAAKASLEE
jgi:hypothetical protein